MHRLFDPFHDQQAGPRRRRWHEEWLYLQVVLRKFRPRLLLLAGVLAVGALVFRWLYRDAHGAPVSFVRGLYYTWCLVFFEPQVDLPHSPVLELLFFVVPLLGLGILIETLVELSLTLRDRRRNEREWCRMIAAEMSAHVLLVGMGRLGYRTYGHLRRMKAPIVVLDCDEKNAFLDLARRDGAPVLIGDARNDQLLIDANIAKARSIICCTNDDLANLEIALDARRMNPGIRVVIRMFDQNMADKVRDGFNIHVAFSTANMAAPSFAAAAYDRSIKHSYLIDGELIVTSEIFVGPESSLAGQSIAEARQRIEFNVLAHTPLSDRARIFPSGAAKLRPGDALLVQLRFDLLDELHRLNRGSAAATPAGARSQP